jgi:hypothetical protein
VRRKQVRNRIINSLWGAAKWIAQRLGEGALPTLGRLAAEWAWKAGAGAGAVWLWEFWRF